MEESRQSVCVAVDAGSGDYAPEAMVVGALDALKRDPRLKVMLVGDVSQLTQIVAAYSEFAECTERLEQVSALSVVDEGGGAAWAVRDARLTASVVLTAQVVQTGRADAGVSVGNTGAALAAATLQMGLFPGIRRPVAGLIFPFAPETCVLDIGPNVEVSARHLLGFAQLGTAYVQEMLGVSRPTVGILSNGREASKGTRQIREAYRLLETSGLHFVGALEGADLVSGAAHVIVTDGYVGNVVLKVVEALAAWTRTRLSEVVSLVPAASQAADSLFHDLDRLSDATRFSSPPMLLGVNGVFLLGHGRSQAMEVAGLIERAADSVRKNVLGRLRIAMTALG